MGNNIWRNIYSLFYYYKAFLQMTKWLTNLIRGKYLGRKFKLGYRYQLPNLEMTIVKIGLFEFIAENKAPNFTMSLYFSYDEIKQYQWTTK